MSDRPVLALLPGLLCDAALWRHQIPALEPRFDCFVPDLSRDDSLPAMAARVLGALPLRFDLVGFSMGGFLAFEILRQDPDRVNRLALLDTRATPDTAETKSARHALLSLAYAGPFGRVTERLLADYLPEHKLEDRALTEEVHAMAERIGPEGLARQIAAIVARPDSCPLLARIACPTLVLCGRQDAAAPLSEHQLMAAAIPDARLNVLDDCGHFSPLEQPEKVTAALERWLER